MLPAPTPSPASGSRPASYLCLAVLVVIYVVLNNSILLHTVRDANLAAKMQAKDSRQYLEIAHDFARGDFSMSYVQFMPHRQPLYSLLLAVPVKVWGDDLFKLGWVNLLAGLALLLCLYHGVLRLFGSSIVAVLTSAAYIANPFMVDKISSRLMTEVLHALCLVVLILFFLAYLRDGKARHLIAASAAAGADYLARPNGLFVLCAMIFTLLCHDGWRLLRKRTAAEPARWPVLRARVLGYLGAGLIFVAVTAPSWVPRYHYFGNPIFHGYLANFMWADSYEQAHTGQAEVSFTSHDYLQGHDWHGFLARWGHGFYRVYLDIPRHTEHVRVLYFLAGIGLLLALAKRRWEYWFLGAFLFIQLLPIVWTIVANPGPRISYGTLFPFELFFAALALSYIVPLVCQGIKSRKGPRPTVET
jgi:hypothetical protein